MKRNLGPLLTSETASVEAESRRTVHDESGRGASASKLHALRGVSP